MNETTPSSHSSFQTEDFSSQTGQDIGLLNHQWLLDYLNTPYGEEDDYCENWWSAQGMRVRLEKRIELRTSLIETSVGNENAKIVISRNFVARQSLNRYFSMLEEGIADMAGIFSERDIIGFLSNSAGTCDAYLANGGIPDEDFPYEIFRKIRRLSLVQYAALVDFREIFWRTENKDSIESFCELMGLVLRED